MFLEDLEDAGAAKQFPSSIHENAFIFALSGGMFGQELVNEFDWYEDTELVWHVDDSGIHIQEISD